MTLEDYNADAICRSVGLNQFVDDTWTGTETAVIRVVYQPSFNPEVVITITKGNSGILLSAVAASIQIWPLERPQPVKFFMDAGNLAEPAFQKFAQLFEPALEKSKESLKHAYLDGMSIEACSLKASRVDKFRAHIRVNAEAGKLATELAKSAWEICTKPEVKNALSVVAAYAGLKLPKLEVCDLPAKPRLEIVVLGASHDNQVLLSAIEKLANGGDSSRK